MRWNNAKESKQSWTRVAGRALAAGVGVVVLAAGAAAQQPSAGGAGADRLAAVKQAAAENQAKLRTYTWTETQQMSLNGEVKSTKQLSCAYGADGKKACTPIGPAPPAPDTRGIRGRIAEKKKEELGDYMQQVKGVIGMYVPPDGARMEACRAAGNMSVSAPGTGEAALVFRNYAQAGDSMSLDFAMAAKKLAGMQVSTYVGDASNPVTLSVQFAPLPDGTNYPAKVVVNAAAKGIVVTETNSNYQKVR